MLVAKMIQTRDSVSQLIFLLIRYRETKLPEDAREARASARKKKEHEVCAMFTSASHRLLIECV